MTGVPQIVEDAVKAYFVGVTKPYTGQVYGALDSLDFVGCIVAIEQTIKKHTGKQVSLLKAENFLHKGNPYRTVMGIAKLAQELLGDKQPAKRSPVLKAVFVDLDNTLWWGVAGEDEIVVYWDLVYALLELHKRGVYITIITKNQRSVIAATEFGRLWGLPALYEQTDKADAIRKCLSENNLTPIGAVFVDDEPMERDRVSSAIPEVEVIAPDGILALLDRISSVTDEDKERANMLTQEYERKATLQRFPSYEEWLYSLEIQVEIRPLVSLSGRPQQLWERSNQFNINKTGELVIPDHGEAYGVWARDKFGDMGMVGLVVSSGCDVYRFVLSCRAMNRGIEDVIVGKHFSFLFSGLRWHYVPTEWNHPAGQFVERMRVGDWRSTPWITVKYGGPVNEV